MHVHNEYLIDRCIRQGGTKSKVLDIGCGKGESVVGGLDKDLDMYGVDKFHEGYWFDLAKKTGLLGERIIQIEGENANYPFPDNTFDFVISNQVFEHINKLNPTISEAKRVLKDSGLLIAIYPTMEMIREVHSGLPPVHWISKEYRYKIIRFMRLLRLGKTNRWSKKPKEWSDKCEEVLDKLVFYKDLKHIEEIINNFFHNARYIERDIIKYRLEKMGHIKLSMFIKKEPIGSILEFMYRRYISTAIESSLK